MKTLYSIFIFISFLSISLNAQIHYVPNDFASIQEAIDNASDNDTILISTGTYLENLEVTKSLTIASEFLLSGDPDDIENTIIDGDSVATTIKVENILTDTVRFVGLKVTGGIGTMVVVEEAFGQSLLHGGGFFIDTVNAVKIDNCILTENKIVSDDNRGGGIYCNNSFLSVKNSEISENLVSGNSFLGEGAGIYLVNSYVFVENVDFIHNKSTLPSYGLGGAIYAKDSELTIDNSFFSMNENNEGGAFYSKDSNVEISNSVFDDNFGYFGSAISVSNSTLMECSFDNITVTNNISLSNNSLGAIGLSRVYGAIINSDISSNNSGYMTG